MRQRFWIEFASARVPLDGGSVLVGRNFDCDVVLQDEHVSRHHALFRLVDGGVEVVALGARPVTVNGADIEGACRLGDGDRVDVEGHGFVVRGKRAPVVPETHWFVERAPGVLVHVGDERLTLGGADGDGLVVPEWPPAVVAVQALGERLVLEAMREEVRVGRPLDAGEMVNVDAGERIEYGGTSLRAVALPSDPSKPTSAPVFDEVVTSAVLTLLPRGGRLALRVGARDRHVYLAEKRSELVACLLRPPPPYAVGALLPDEALAEALWPGKCSGRTDINTLLWRVRKDFADAGLDRVSFFERVGGGIRAKLAAGARAEVVGSSSTPR